MFIRLRKAIQDHFEHTTQDSISHSRLTAIVDAEEKAEREIERSPWLEFEKRWTSADTFTFLVPEPWRIQPLPHGGYVELRYQVDGEIVSSISGRAVWPKGLPADAV